MKTDYRVRKLAVAISACVLLVACLGLGDLRLNRFNLTRYFNVKDQKIESKKQRVICLFGINFKCKASEEVKIVKIAGGLGNQMFQYAFGKALEYEQKQKVLFDDSWFLESKKEIVNNKKENSIGVVMRGYGLDIFSLDIPFASDRQIKSCKNRIYEKKDFIYDRELLKDYGSSYYIGYFQNENYFKKIRSQIKGAFRFPPIHPSDKFNYEWLNKIRKSKNSVFIHLRRGDYLNLQGWALSTNYYKKAVRYIKENVENPCFFVFGQNCSDYLKKEFNIDASFEIIGETNSENNEDWKDLVLMKACKHAIIANSTFSWWAAWLGRANTEGIVIAPTPFVNGRDEIVCDNWIKIKR